MINLRSIASVFRFETRKAATFSRMAWWLALALFPVLLTFLLQWADDVRQAGATSQAEQNGMNLEPREIRVTRFSKGGVPTIDVDGKELSGLAALGHLDGLGNSDTKQQIGKAIGNMLEGVTKEAFGEAETDESKEKKTKRGRRPRRPRKPDLIVTYAADIAKDDEGKRKSRTVLKDSFERVIYMREGDPEPPSMRSLVWGAGLFILLPTVVAMLSTFLWAAPAIGSELEGRSWAYIATRPDGPVSVLLGKYLVGVAWGISAAMTSLVLSLMVVKYPEGFMHLFAPLATLIVIACPAYGAIFTLIGAIAPRRAMVIAVVYAIALEGLVSFLPVLNLPALISRITIQYPMRSMMVRWLDLDLVPEDATSLTRIAVSESSLLIDLGSIALITVAALAAAIFVMKTQELTAADESDS
jgi:hypothetical protein